jgi:hypothetical protein
MQLRREMEKRRHTRCEQLRNTGESEAEANKILQRNTRLAHVMTIAEIVTAAIVLCIVKGVVALGMGSNSMGSTSDSAFR